jgi:RNA polymerase sigma-70 factor, ECF subfamily
MEQLPDLVATFVECANGRVELPDEPAQLGQLLGHAFESARAAWPDVTLSAKQFVRYIAERLPETGKDRSVEQLLRQKSLPELYLACACVHGVPGSLDAFERSYLAMLPAQLRRIKKSNPAIDIDEVCQQVRVQFLLRPAAGLPQIIKYSGEGSLMSWLCVCAARVANKMRAGDKSALEEDIGVAIETLPAPGVDPEMELIKQRYRDEFRKAAHDAFSTLASDQQYLFRLHYIDGLSMFELSEMYNVHRTTVLRWLESARQILYKRVRRLLKERLQISTREVESLLKVLRSQLDVSLGGGEEGEDHGEGEAEDQERGW